MDERKIKPIAHIENAFDSKFGIPRQSGMTAQMESRIVFEPEYRAVEAFRGIEEFSHLWLLWDFSEAHRSEFSPTVRPPMLGGNKRMGVFATRSPFRPNSIGLTVVKLVRLEAHTPDGPMLIVTGADMMNGTPIYDVKPYLPKNDAIADARGGFADEVNEVRLDVTIPAELERAYDAETMRSLRIVLSGDPRPQYQHQDGREYVMTYAKKDVRFVIEGTSLRVISIK